MRPDTINVLRIGNLSVLWRPRTAVICAVLATVGLILSMALLCTGSLALTPSQIIASLMGMHDNSAADRVVLHLRLPRVLTAAFVGAALGMAGAIFQSISRNALGSPDVIGFTSGAATGAIVQIILFDAGPVVVSLAAALSGLVTALVILFLSQRGMMISSHRLVLVGIGIGAIMSAFNSVLLVMGNLDSSMSAQLWLAGSLSARTWSHVMTMAIGFAVIAPVVVWHARRITLIEMGDDPAAQLGVDVQKTRLMMVMAAVSLTSLATAAAGPIAFVALAGPQLARRLTRSSDAPIVSGAIMGSVLLLAADLVSQRFPFNAAVQIGQMTGLLGGLYLLWLLTRSRAI